MSQIPKALQEIASAVENGEARSGVTTRDVLSWFDSQRRGRLVNNMIRKGLRRAKLRTEPRFEYAYIDEYLTFLPTKSAEQSRLAAETQEANDAPSFLSATTVDDPTYRIGKLDSANQAPVSVNPTASLREAITLMLYHDYSQLPVMQGVRDLKGAISWQSIGRALALRHECNSVRDCLEEVADISSDTSLFAAIPTIVEKQFVVIRDATKKIVGIVTTTDLSIQFCKLTEPFLLLGEIENHLRRLSDGKFTQAQLASLKDPADDSREILDLSDLTFGEHIRLLEQPVRWSALGLNIDRGTFVKHLDAVREIRNDVMHFDPDGAGPDDLAKLRNFVRLLVYLGQTSMTKDVT